MESSTDRATTRPLGAETAAHATRETNDVDSEDGMLGSPLQLDSSTMGTAELNSALESLSSATVPNMASCIQNNLSLAQNFSQTRVTLPPGHGHGSSVRGAENVKVCVKAPAGGQETLLPGGVPPTTASFATKCDTSHVAAPTREFSATWSPQGLLGGTPETLDARPAVDDASSMVAVVLGEEVPDDLPRAPSAYTEPRSCPSTPLVNTIHLNLQYTRHLMSNSQHFYASSSSCAAANEVPLDWIGGGAEALEPAKLREVTFAHSSVEARDSSEGIPLIDPSAIGAPRREHFVERCLVEEEQERTELVEDQASGFETILAHEVSAYLAMSRQQRMIARQRSECAGVTEQRKSVEEEASQLHDSMRARMRMAEDEHENFMSNYRPIQQVQLHSAG
ncbi:hypothetical protein CGC20_29275 [Leishmania donovani]|uniref:Uncharacterized protein n=1 Tax=Leishmania donovani TaxID=5661 RepID=A0A504X213_LEIDO|nr:hypothetical protein CGC20_29275 [Leishmania donovani]